MKQHFVTGADLFTDSFLPFDQEQRFMMRFEDASWEDLLDGPLASRDYIQKPIHCCPYSNGRRIRQPSGRITPATSLVVVVDDLRAKGCGRSSSSATTTQVLTGNTIEIKAVGDSLSRGFGRAANCWLLSSCSPSDSA